MGGNQCSITGEESSDSAMVSGLCDSDGDSIYGEFDRAYHISEFCTHHKLELKIIEQEFDFDTIWNSGELK